MLFWILFGCVCADREGAAAGGLKGNRRSSSSSSNSVSSSSSRMASQEPAEGFSLTSSLVAHQACSFFMPFAASSSRAVAATGSSSTAAAAASALLAAAAAPCCSCPRTLAGDCKRLRAWERRAEVDAVQQPLLYERLACLLEQTVTVPCCCEDASCRRASSSSSKKSSSSTSSSSTTTSATEDDFAVRHPQPADSSSNSSPARSSSSSSSGSRSRGSDGGPEDVDSTSSSSCSSSSSCNDSSSSSSSSSSKGGGGGRGSVHYVERSVAMLLLGSSEFNGIELDVHRTFPSIPFFREEGQHALRRILQAFAVFDPEVGYVQGMNFVAGALLYHSNTTVHCCPRGPSGSAMRLLQEPPEDPLTAAAAAAAAAAAGDCKSAAAAAKQHFTLRTRENRVFWLMASLFYFYELRRLYLPSLPGVFERCAALEKMLEMQTPELLEHLQTCGVSLPLLTSDWLLTLFAYTIPLPALSLVLTQFFEEGWVFLYKLVCARLKRMSAPLLAATDIVDVVTIAKTSPPPPRLNLLGGSVLSWLSAASETAARAGVGGEQATRVLQSVSSAIKKHQRQQLQPLSSNPSNDPNSCGSGSAWTGIVDDVLEMSSDRRAFIELELKMLEAQQPLSAQPVAMGSCDPLWRRVAEAEDLLQQQQQTRDLLLPETAAAAAAAAGGADAAAADAAAAAAAAADTGVRLCPLSSATPSTGGSSSPVPSPLSSSSGSSSSSSSGRSSSSSSREGCVVKTSERLYVKRTAALLRSLGREETAKETEEVCALAFSHQRLLLQVAAQRQHLQRLARQVLLRPTQLPETLSHWMADAGNC
ncbi:hypothetical protein Efla_006205 [Eimeria flavescens]